MSCESPTSTDNEWDEWEIINLQTNSVSSEVKAKKSKKKEVENLAKEIQNQLTINQKEEKMKLEELTNQLNEQRQISEAKLQEITFQLESIVKLQQIAQHNHQETNAKLQEANNKLQQIQKETKKQITQQPPILPLPSTTPAPVTMPIFPLTSPSLFFPQKPQPPPQLTNFQSNFENNNNNKNNNNKDLNNLDHGFTFGGNSNSNSLWQPPSLITNANTNINPKQNSNIITNPNVNTNFPNNYMRNNNKTENSIPIVNNIQTEMKVDNSDKNRLKLKLKKFFGEGVFLPNEKRQCGWVLTASTQSKLKFKGRLDKIAGDEIVIVNTQKSYEFEISSNEDIQILCDVVAPNIVGKYLLLFQFNVQSHNAVIDLELNIDVKSQFSKNEEEMISNIVKMGFNDRNKIIYSLQKSKWNLQQALEDLLNN